MKQLISEIAKQNIKDLVGELIDTHHQGLNNAISKAEDARVSVSISLGLEFISEGIFDIEAGISYSVEKVKDKIQKHINERQGVLDAVNAMRPKPGDGIERIEITSEGEGIGMTADKINTIGGKNA